MDTADVPTNELAFILFTALTVAALTLPPLIDGDDTSVIPEMFVADTVGPWNAEVATNELAFILLSAVTVVALTLPPLIFVKADMFVALRSVNLALTALTVIELI